MQQDIMQQNLEVFATPNAVLPGGGIYFYRGENLCSRKRGLGLAQQHALLPVLFSSICALRCHHNGYIPYQLIFMISSIIHLLPHNICFIHCQVCWGIPENVAQMQ